VRTRRWVNRITAAAIASIALLSPTALASNGDDESAVNGVRQATAAFHDLNKAIAAQYGPLLSCFDLPGVGGMGQHYVNQGLLDAKVEANRPEALVYEVDSNRLQLVAVEYIVPWTAWVSADPPQLFGRTFFRNTTLHLWALHAWIWRPNPLGMFQNYNPNVKLCPAGA
jgi:hypothetical protein